jgi:hypothetical protein
VTCLVVTVHTRQRQLDTTTRKLNEAATRTAGDVTVMDPSLYAPLRKPTQIYRPRTNRRGITTHDSDRGNFATRLTFLSASKPTLNTHLFRYPVRAGDGTISAHGHAVSERSTSNRNREQVVDRPVSNETMHNHPLFSVLSISHLGNECHTASFSPPCFTPSLTACEKSANCVTIKCHDKDGNIPRGEHDV